MNTKKAMPFIRNNSLLLFLVLLIIIGYSISDRFLSLDNILNILRVSSIFGIVALGLTFVMICGEMDISVGAIVSLTSVSVVAFMNYYNYFIPEKYNYIPAIIMILIVGILVGVINGFLIGILKANSIIITIGMLSIFEVIAWIYGKKRFISVTPRNSFLVIGKGFISIIPIPVIIFTVLAITSYIILSKTTMGKYIYATGADEEIAWIAGIKTKKIRLLTFIISGIFCSIAGIVLASRMGGSQAFTGSFYLFDAITAVILGGTSLYGGSGSIGKTVAGVAVVGILSNILVYTGYSWASQQFFKGLILILAILVNTFLNIGRNRIQDEK